VVAVQVLKLDQQQQVQMLDQQVQKLDQQQLD
jgi:hypothetical protein